MTPREEILHFITNNPKQYSVMIKKRDHLIEWINANTLVSTDHLPTRIWSAIHNDPLKCGCGNERMVKRWGEGPTRFCSPRCDAIKSHFSESVSAAKRNYSEERKAEIKAKREATMVEKFGVAYSFQRPEVKEKLTGPKIPQEVWEKLNNYDWLYNQHVGEKRSALEIANDLQIYYGTVISYIHGHGIPFRRGTQSSIAEKELLAFIESLGVECKPNDYDAIGKEIGVYVPSKRVGFEMNGLYWHSYSGTKQEASEDGGFGETRNRHLKKTLLAWDRNVELIHITDAEWRTQRDKIENLIRAKLGLTQIRLYARKLELREVPRNEEREFLDANHLQNYIASKVCLGLYADSQLVSLASFGKPRFNGKYDWELLRFCNSQNVSVAGGLSKLITAFRRDHSGSLLTYCDASKSRGVAYVKAGFTQIDHTSPGFMWNDGTNVISRLKATHGQMKKWLPTYDPTLSQTANMFAAKYRRYWDCGQLVFEMK